MEEVAVGGSVGVRARIGGECHEHIRVLSDGKSRHRVPRRFRHEAGEQRCGLTLLAQRRHDGRRGRDGEVRDRRDDDASRDVGRVGWRAEAAGRSGTRVRARPASAGGHWCGRSSWHWPRDRAPSRPGRSRSPRAPAFEPPCPRSPGTRRSDPDLARSRNCPRMRMPYRSWASMKCSSNTRTRVSRVLGWSVYCRSSMIGQPGSSHADVRSWPGRAEEPVPREGLGPLVARAGWYHRTRIRATLAYGHTYSAHEPSHPPGRAQPRRVAAADLRVHPAGHPRRRRGPGDAAALVARPGGRPRGVSHDHAAGGAAAPGRGLSHRAPRIRDVRGGGAAGRSDAAGGPPGPPE